MLRYFPTAVFLPCYTAFPTLPAINIFACITSLRGQFDIPPLTCNNQQPPGRLISKASESRLFTKREILSVVKPQSS